MTRPLPGQVRIDGLFEGPTRSWTPDEDRLRDALQRAGAPDNALDAVIEGGQASLEPCPMALPRGQFSAEPAECIALALEMLLGETAGGRPDDWYSTLRVTEYEESQRRETLIRVEGEGVRTATRELPWEPPPPPRMTEQLRRNLGVILLVVAGAGVGAWLQRDQLRGWADGVVALFSGGLAVAEDLEVDPGAFDAWIEVRGEEDHHRGQDYVVTLRARDAYPRSGRAVDRLREDAGPEELAALQAIESGEATLALRFEEGATDALSVDLIAMLEDGEITVAVEAEGRRGMVLEAVRLEP